MMMPLLNKHLDDILANYQTNFAAKIYPQKNNDLDLLMQVFNLTPALKRENDQYWGRELGMCWQRLVYEVCKNQCDNFQPALRIGADEPCDLIVGNYAIDTKYRIGSGDSGTLKKFKYYGAMLTEQGYIPTLVIVREDNLTAALQACMAGGWSVYIGENAFDFIQKLSGFDIKDFLSQRAAGFPVYR